MNEKTLIRTLILVIFCLIIIYAILRVGAGLDLGFGPYIKNQFQYLSKIKLYYEEYMNKKHINEESLFTFISTRIKELPNSNYSNIRMDTNLIGNNNLIKSSELFEIFMDLEVYLKDYKIEFDWPKMIVDLSNKKTDISVSELIEYILSKY